MYDHNQVIWPWIYRDMAMNQVRKRCTAPCQRWKLSCVSHCGTCNRKETIACAILNHVIVGVARQAENLLHTLPNSPTVTDVPCTSEKALVVRSTSSRPRTTTREDAATTRPPLHCTLLPSSRSWWSKQKILNQNSTETKNDANVWYGNNKKGKATVVSLAQPYSRHSLTQCNSRATVQAATTPQPPRNERSKWSKAIPDDVRATKHPGSTKERKSTKECRWS